MSANNGSPGGSEPAREATAGECGTCRELGAAEALANAARDFSRATDCRVLLRRHRQATGCLRNAS
ncbi:hypothetical protein AB0J21_28275 [Streptomyces sp. NPDC049954]|uniref:hypothetical protein n=1 Tax=Streptomyces sp. NPDC049954 TaxID=3155779 RepID=UPI003437D3A8